jgi:valyl-tRNA synthetase
MAQLTELTVSRRDRFEVPAQAAVNSGVEMDVVILLEGLIDLGAERERLTKEIEKLDKRRQSLKKRLGSSGFRDRAPESVVQETEGNLRDVEDQIARLEERITALSV